MSMKRRYDLYAHLHHLFSIRHSAPFVDFVNIRLAS